MTLIALALLAPDARAGAWTREVGHFYAKAGASVYTATRFVPPGAAEPVKLNFWSQQYQLYGEGAARLQGGRSRCSRRSASAPSRAR
ncbi:MAG: hypothetical protein R3F59_26125 [Myxococcota bacterium]